MRACYQARTFSHSGAEDTVVKLDEDSKVTFTAVWDESKATLTSRMLTEDRNRKGAGGPPLAEGPWIMNLAGDELESTSEYNIKMVMHDEVRSSKTVITCSYRKAP